MIRTASEIQASIDQWQRLTDREIAGQLGVAIADAPAARGAEIDRLWIEAEDAGVTAEIDLNRAALDRPEED